jgi:hypothetical protein
LVAAKVVRSELVRRLSEMGSERRHRPHVAVGCTIRVITMLEFLQHYLA